jgi:hypothetical protein
MAGATVRRAAMGESMKQAVRDALPPNWQGRTVGEVDQFLTMSEETGLNTVWVPRLDVIRELLAAEDDQARGAVLNDRRSDILDDVETCLGGVTHDSLVDDVRLARQAVGAVRDGYDAPGQALAASVLSGTVHDLFAFQRFGDARKRFIRDDPDHVGLSMFRIIAILRTFGRAVTKTDEADPGFNRHASLHAHEGQYTSSHAVSALLLLAGVLREADHLLYRQERTQSDEASEGAAEVASQPSPGRMGCGGDRTDLGAG